MTDWRPVMCPTCHLSRFSVKTRREDAAVPAQTPGAHMAPQKPSPIRVFQIECQNCRHVLVRLGRAEG